MTKLLEMKLPGNPDFIRISKNAVMTAASLAECNIDLIDEIGMAVYEACKNISCHGYDGWCKTYDVEVNIEEENFSVTVSSEGEQHTLEKRFKPCLDCPREGDIGIALIYSLMDKVEIDKDGKGGKAIKMVKKIC